VDAGDAFGTPGRQAFAEGDHAEADPVPQRVVRGLGTGGPGQACGVGLVDERANVLSGDFT
jgi:hypothetical protein